METTKLSSKGQIVLPKSLRDARNWKPGTEFAVEEADGGLLLRPIVPFPVTSLKDVVGCLSHKGKAKTIGQMHKAIASAIKERRGRGRY